MYSPIILTLPGARLKKSGSLPNFCTKGFLQRSITTASDSQIQRHRKQSWNADVDRVSVVRALSKFFQSKQNNVSPFPLRLAPCLVDVLHRLLWDRHVYSRHQGILGAISKMYSNCTTCTSQVSVANFFWISPPLHVLQTRPDRG